VLPVVQSDGMLNDECFLSVSVLHPYFCFYVFVSLVDPLFLSLFQWLILLFILLIFNLIVYRYQPNPIVTHLDEGKFDTLQEGDASSAMDGQELEDAAARRMKAADGGPEDTPTSDTPAVKKDGEEEGEKKTS
jgi:membrane-associated protease RseP (regulator of RpoE activity)